MPNWYIVLILALYGFTVCAGILGNIGLYYIIKYLNKPKNETVSDFFMSSIAVGDIALTFASIPFTKISSFLFESWPFGAAACTLAEYLQWCLVLQKSFVMVAMSCDRHFIIAFPLKRRLSKRKAKFIVLMSYITSFLIALPTALTSQVIYVYMDDKFAGLCTEIWELKRSKLAYTIVLTLVHFIIPLFVLILSNTHVVYLILSRKTPGEPDKRRDQTIASTKRKVKL